MENITAKYSSIIITIVCGIIGVIVFLLLFGTGTLDVTNDDWIMVGYDEEDLIAHYAGWTNFKDQPWEFPLGYSSLNAYPIGGNIGFADSIPLVAIITKIFKNILPSTFQYFGLYMLFNFFMQGASSGLLISRLFKDKNLYLGIIYSIIGSLFFILAPIFLERGFRHTALSSHYFILLSIYFYLEYREKYNNKNSKKIPSIFIVLSSLSVGIHPYLMPMCMIFVLLLTIDYIRYNKAFLKPLLFFISNLVGIVAMGIIIGTIGGSAISTSRGGFGLFSMNLNALINPVSVGEYQWSLLLMPRSQIGGNYDGFNYLGIGFLMLIAFVVFININNFVKNEFDKSEFKLWIKRNIYYIFACIFLTMFAVSNVVTLEGKVLFEIKIGEMIEKLCGIFRASSRMFYPVYYSIMLFCIYSTYRMFCTKKSFKSQISSILVLSMFFCVQLIDISKALIQKHDYMIKTTTIEQLDFSEILWNEELESKTYKYSQCMFFLNEDKYYDVKNIKRVLVFTGKNNYRTNATFFADGMKSFRASRYNIYLELKNRIIDSKTLYVTTDISSYQEIKTLYENENLSVDYIEMNGIYFILP